MILRSVRTLSFGLILGLLIGFAVKFLLPSLYFYFLFLLEQKTQAQTAAVGGYSSGILLNNALASFLCAYGGYFTTRMFLLINSESSSFLKKFSVLDNRITGLHEAELKYYLSLHALPVFILFSNGFVLGSIFTLYISNPGEYFLGLLPHGFFEIPAILLAGSIGYTIADAVFTKSGNLEAELALRAKSQKNRFLIVLGLITIAAFLEA